MMPVERRADGNHRLVASYRCVQRMIQIAEILDQCTRLDHRTGMQNYTTMNIVHFEQVAEERGIYHSVALHRIQRRRQCAPPRARHASQPIKQMQPCTRPIAFRDGPL
jgi:hypothetical protein